MSTKVQSYKIERFICVHLCKFNYTNPQTVLITILFDKPCTTLSSPHLANSFRSACKFITSLFLARCGPLVDSARPRWVSSFSFVTLELCLKKTPVRNNLFPFHLLENSALLWIYLRSPGNGNVNRNQTAVFRELLWNLASVHSSQKKQSLQLLKLQSEGGWMFTRFFVASQRIHRKHILSYVYIANHIHIQMLLSSVELHWRCSAEKAWTKAYWCQWKLSHELQKAFFQSRFEIRLYHLSWRSNSISHKLVADCDLCQTQPCDMIISHHAAVKQ